MEIRNTKENEIDSVMAIYEIGKKTMRDTGNANQWINGYPQREIILDDIANGNSYVLVDEDRVHAVFSLIGGADPCYEVIKDGEWLNDEPYMTIHRIASGRTVKHAADICYDWAMTKTDNLRIDTHEDNKVMQKVLDRNGFIRCGYVYLADGSPRIAYQKVK